MADSAISWLTWLVDFIVYKDRLCQVILSGHFILEECILYKGVHIQLRLTMQIFCIFIFKWTTYLPSTWFLFFLVVVVAILFLFFFLLFLQYIFSEIMDNILTGLIIFHISSQYKMPCLTVTVISSSFLWNNLWLNWWICYALR